MSECNTGTPPPPPSKRPAHELLVEISTRIASQDLHYRSGHEEAAVVSIVSLFETTRQLMRANPDATEFLELAAAVLEKIRPYTARWHSLEDADNRLLGPAQRLQVRDELVRLQDALGPDMKRLNDLRNCGQPWYSAADQQRPPLSLGTRVRAGIPTKTTRCPADAEKSKLALPPDEAHACMNIKEAAHIAARRGVAGNPEIYDGAGLALSGGGIRSATFCLGVVQALAKARLFRKFDYLSTVSGGGYLGSFISNQTVSSDDELESIFTGHADSTDSTAVRHLRNNSKYLLPSTTYQRLELAGLLISGILATTLLVMAVPVFCALAVHVLFRLEWLDEKSGGPFLAQPFWLATAVFVAVALVCWLIRPITPVWHHLRRQLDWLTARLTLLTGVSVAIAVTPLCLTLLETEGLQLHHTASVATLTTLITGGALIKAASVAWKYRKALSRLFILSGGVLFVIAYFAVLQALQSDPSGFWTHPRLTDTEVTVGGALLAWLIWAAVVSLNLTGLHRYYRDRLASCYLERPDSRDRSKHPLPLADLPSNLPYHLINTTVNLTSSENPDLRGRGGDFFLLSKHYCGSTITQYHSTEDLTEMNWDLDLATAMAISGAAASTNMGWQTMHEYRTLMAIFNVRLGYWMRWNRKTFGSLASNAFVELTREIFGLLTEQSSTLNVSDGGHIENLAAYELVRRKLKFIVCVDGGLDSAMDCGDLNRLQRLIAIDFGYRLQFDPADLKIVGGFSTAYGLLARIDYSPNDPYHQKELGWMLYIKLALLGTEANYVLDYRRENPQFPHQTTLDQFFDEAQFEAYRKLGEAAAASFLSDRFDTTTVKGFDDWFQKLAGRLLPDSDPAYKPSAAK